MATLNWCIYFTKELGRLSSAGPEILVFVSHCSANFQPIFDCFIPNLNLKYEDSENIKADCIQSLSTYIKSNVGHSFLEPSVTICNNS